VFKSKLTLFLSISIIVFSLFYFYTNLDSLDKLNPSYYTVYDIPLDSNNLAVSYEGECLGHLSLKHEVDSLISIFAELKDHRGSMENKQLVAKAESYFNMIGQLIKFEVLFKNKKYSVLGIKDLTFHYKNEKGEDKTEVYKGPVDILIEDRRLKIMYRYPFKKKVEIIERKDCA